MMMRITLPLSAICLLSGCFAFVTKEEGREIKQQTLVAINGSLNHV